MRFLGRDSREKDGGKRSKNLAVDLSGGFRDSAISDRS